MTTTAPIVVDTPNQQRERLALEHYHATGRSGDAMLFAGLASDPVTARIQGNNLVTKPNAKVYLARLAKQRLETGRSSIHRIRGEMETIAFSDMARYFDEEGNLKPIQDLDPMLSRAIASVKVRRVKPEEGEESCEVIELKLYDKKGMLEHLSEIEGMIQRLTVNVNLPPPVEEVKAKLEHWMQTQGLVMMTRSLVQRLIDGDESAKVEAQAMLVEVK